MEAYKNSIVTTSSAQITRELSAAINKAKQLSWRAGVAWALCDQENKVILCNGGIFGSHLPLLANDLKRHPYTKYLHISYLGDGVGSEMPQIIELLTLSCIERIYTLDAFNSYKFLSSLGWQSGIPITLFCDDQTLFNVNIGISTIASAKKPWIHIITAATINGDNYSFSNLKSSFGIIPFIIERCRGSNKTYVQNLKDLRILAEEELDFIQPNMIDNLDFSSLVNSQPDANNSVITLICSQEWTLKLIDSDQINEMTYYQALPDNDGINSARSTPSLKNWRLCSSETVDDINRLTLLKKYEI